jgi:hypothetical protein
MKTQISPRVAALLERTRATRGRLIFAIDATGSRQEGWDLAASLQTAMFEQSARIGGLEVQLLWYRGSDECSSTPWTADTSELAQQMRRIRCESGATQIGRVLDHIKQDNARKKVDAAIFVGDAVEEIPQKLYDAAAGLGVPVFWFQEGSGLAIYIDQRGEIVHQHPVTTVQEVFERLADLSHGAYAKFDAGAAARLGELLAAVAAFASGGLKALADLRTDSARNLLTQMRK